MNNRAEACNGKQPFTRGEAHARASALKKGGNNMSAYQCPACGHWHIGRGPADKKRARKDPAQLSPLHPKKTRSRRTRPRRRP